VCDALARYHALLYLVFTKGEFELGKALAFIVNDKPLTKHFEKVFGIKKCNEIKERTYCFLDKYADELKSYIGRESFLIQFEREYFMDILYCLEDIIRFKPLSENGELRYVDLWIDLEDFIDLLDKIAYGYGIVKTAGLCDVLVKVLRDRDKKLLNQLSRLGLTIYLPKDHEYLDKSLQSEDHFIIPCISLQPFILMHIKNIISSPIIEFHKDLQKFICELGRVLGYKVETEAQIESFKLDVVWMKDNKIAKAFEVQLRVTKPEMFKVLQRLRKAHEKGAEIFIIVPNEEALSNAKSFIRSEARDLENVLNIITARGIKELYKIVKKEPKLVSILRG